MLYGAGASDSSGILLASEIVHGLCLTGYCQKYGIKDTASRERVTRQDVPSWLELNDWYSEAKLRGESEHSAAFRQFKPTYEHQIAYIRQLLDSKRPSTAYEALAVLAHEGHFGLFRRPRFTPPDSRAKRGNGAANTSRNPTRSSASSRRGSWSRTREIYCD